MSDEIERDDLNDSLRQKSSPSKVRYSSYLNYREADPQHFMKVWPLLPGLTLAEHYWLEPYDEWREFSAQLQNGEKEHPVLIRLLEDSVALSTWCFGAYRVHQVSRDIAGLGAGSNPAKRFLQELEAIASRGGQNDLIEFIFSEHSHFFRLSAKKGAFGLGVLDQPQHLAELGDLLFVHLSLFPLPVEPSVLDESPEIRRLLLKLVAPGVIKPDSQHYKPLRLDLLCKVLLHFEQHNLLIRVRPKPLKPGDVLKPKPTDAVRDRFTLQHQLRDYVGFKMDLHIPDQGERNYFQVSIFPDQPKDLPSPLAAHYKMIRELMDRQINYSRLALWCLYQLRKHALDESSGESYAFLPKTQRTYAQDGLKRRLTDETGGVDNSLEIYHQVSQRTRALYGLLRSGFSLGTISRLPSIDQSGEPDQPYERFGGWLRGLCNTAIGLETWQDTLKQLYRGELGADIQKEVWGTNMPHRKAFQKNLPIPRPFYRDELGWIYNERGLLKLVQGKIYDAIPLFRNALEIMHHHGERKNDPALNAAVRRVQLNLALARLERGNLETARRMLSGLILPKDSSSHSGSQVSWIARGYLALIDHIGGSFDRVEGVYEETIALANTRGMLRLEAIVNRHWSDLLRRKGDLDSALEKVNKSISTARQAEQRDVLHYARLAKSRILLANGETGSTELVHSVLKAVQFAQSMGVPRLECEALRIHAEIMLAQGERILAGQTAARSAAIANRHGLRLLKLSSLRVYGLALAKRQQLEFARTIITETRREAEHRDYQGLTGRLSADLDDLPLGFAK
ncbi:MAG: tetratricopeptide repeat protein [Pseudomonadota bacterium]